jgi:hypothetical protein
MKLRVTLKDPDGIQDCVQDAVETTRPADITNDEWAEIASRRRGEITGQWFKYGDYCTVEIDTVAKTARVLTAAEDKG